MPSGLPQIRIANVGKRKSRIETPIRICEALDCDVLDVIELEEDRE